MGKIGTSKGKKELGDASNWKNKKRWPDEMVLIKIKAIKTVRWDFADARLEKKDLLAFPELCHHPYATDN